MQTHQQFSSLYRAQNSDPVNNGLGRCLAEGRVPTTGQAADLGAGLGHATSRVLIHGSFQRVVAVDVDERALPELEARVSSAVTGLGTRTRLETVHGDALTFLGGEHCKQWDLVLGIHFVCQLDHESRRCFFSKTRQALAPDGCLLLDRHFGSADTGEVPRRCSGVVAVEGGQIERWFTSSPAREGEYQTIRNEYVLVSDDGTRRTLEVKRSRMAICSESRAIDEAQDAGLTTRWTSEHLVALG